MQGVRGSGGDGCRAHVLHHHDLLGGVARRGRQLHGTDFGDAVMHAQTAGEETVAVGHLHHVAGTDVADGQHTGHALRPHVEVVLRVDAHDGLSGGAAGGVDALDLIGGHSLKPEGIFVAQVILRGEGQLRDVVDRLDVFRLHAQLVHLSLVEGHVLVAPLHGGGETFALELAHVLAGHALHLGIVYHFFLLCCCV